MSAPARSIEAVSSPRREKSAARIEGAISGLRIVSRVTGAGDRGKGAPISAGLRVPTLRLGGGRHFRSAPARASRRGELRPVLFQRRLHIVQSEGPRLCIV